MGKPDPRNFAYGQYWKRDKDDELVPDDEANATAQSEAPVQATAERLDRNDSR